MKDRRSSPHRPLAQGTESGGLWKLGVAVLVIMVLAFALLAFGGAFRPPPPEPPTCTGNTDSGDFLTIMFDGNRSTVRYWWWYMSHPALQREVVEPRYDDRATAANEAWPYLRRDLDGIHRAGRINDRQYACGLEWLGDLP